MQVRPLPLGLERFELDDAPLRGARVSITWDVARGLRLFVDGRLAAERSELGPLAAPLETARLA